MLDLFLPYDDKYFFIQHSFTFNFALCCVLGNTGGSVKTSIQAPLERQVEREEELFTT